MIDSLNDLMADPKNVVYVMSGRQPEELDSTFRNAFGIGLIAENGCFIREYGPTARPWQSFVDLRKMKGWKKEARQILKYYLDRINGSTLEVRQCSMLFHYDNAENSRQAGECAEQVNTAFKHMGVQAIPVPNTLIVEQTEFNKATAAVYIYNSLCETKMAPDFFMVAGNDRDDEAAFRYANMVMKDGCTVSIGRRNTEAQATLQGSTGLLGVLEMLPKAGGMLS